MNPFTSATLFAVDLNNALNGLSCGTAFNDLIDSVKEINPEWLVNTEIVLITAGASAPEDVVEECVEWLRLNYNAQVENRIIREEHVQFPLPRELRVISNSVS